MRNRSQQMGVFCGIIFFLIILPYSLAIAHGWMAPENDAQMKNFIKTDENSIEQGQELYNQNCNSCLTIVLQGIEGIQ